MVQSDQETIKQIYKTAPGNQITFQINKPFISLRLEENNYQFNKYLYFCRLTDKRPVYVRIYRRKNSRYQSGGSGD
ncbi:hypothetical protein DSECCO2_265620 [anaerobic digester metagenome]